MKVKPGYLYHIKDEFFEVAKDDKLMQNKPHGGGRPTLICKIQNSDFLWAVPISSKTEKYKDLLKRKQEKYKDPFDVVIGVYGNRENAFLLQNIYPITEQYIDHIHKRNSKALPVRIDLYKEITAKVSRILDITKNGYKVTKTDIPRLTALLQENAQERERRDLYNEPISDRYVAWMKEREKEQAKEKTKKHQKPVKAYEYDD